MTTPVALTLRDQAAIRDRWLGERLDGVVPEIMDRHGVDAWVLIAREYNEDPVVVSMLPATWLSARRRTILVFTDHGRKRAAVTRYPVGEHFAAAWQPESQPDQWSAVADLLTDADPARIALNVSETFALADGLSHHEHEAFVGALPPRLRSRVMSGEHLAIGWLEARLPDEVEALARACQIAHKILGRALSSEAITPQSTTTGDLEWWLREEVRRAGLDVWFHPSASVQRNNGNHSGNFANHPKDEVILHGDLVHIDFGIVYLALHTDQQQHAYVLKPGEKTAPLGLRLGLRLANRAQDLLMAELAAGRTGNEVLAAARSSARSAAIDATIYTHAIGLHGHGAGPTIGLWDQQEGVAGPGEYPLYPDTAYSIELSVAATVGEWGGQRVRFMLEEDAVLDGGGVRFLDGRQTELLLVG